MPQTDQKTAELHQARKDMQAYVDLLPEGDEERELYEREIAELDTRLATYAARSKADEAAEDAEAEDAAESEADTDEDDDDEDEDDEDEDDLDAETAEAIETLKARLKEEGYAVDDGGEDDEDEASEVKPASKVKPKTYSRAPLPEVISEILRDDIDERVSRLVEEERLLPYQSDQVRAACYALLDVTPGAGVTGGLRVYSRDGGGNTPEGDRRAAVRDLLTVLGEREPHAMTRTYSRADVPESPSVVLNPNSDAKVITASAQLAGKIAAISQERGVSFAEATRIYERENGKADLRRY